MNYDAKSYDREHFANWVKSAYRDGQILIVDAQKSGRSKSIFRLVRKSEALHVRPLSHDSVINPVSDPEIQVYQEWA